MPSLSKIWFELSKELDKGSVEKEISSFLKGILHRRKSYTSMKYASLKRYNEIIRGRYMFYFERMVFITKGLHKEVKKRVKKKSFPRKIKRRSEIKRRSLKEVHLIVSKLLQVESRLKKIISRKNYSDQDDGSETLTNILSEYEAIAKEIYGKVGYKYLTHVNRKARKKIRKFNKSFKIFSRKYLVLEKKSSLFGTELKKACQDARPFRRMFLHANSFTQEGYDFLTSNSELFHSYIFKLGKKYFLTRKQKIQFHLRSTDYAKRILKGEKISKELEEKYINRRFIGAAIIAVDKARDKASSIQNFIEKNSCVEKSYLD